MALLFASGLPGDRFLLVALLAPYAISEVTAVAMWRFLFDPDIGPATEALRALGLPMLDWSFVPLHALIIIGAADHLAAVAVHLRHPLRRAAGHSGPALRGRHGGRRQPGGRSSAT